ncbi:MAG: YicC family protein [Rhodocyclaceae bacterium]|nr:YicC family protein [Rhodocyclaceae bacterium]
MAIHSMTGFAAGVRELGEFSLALELKSVNGRFLDLALRLPEELRALEMTLRERIAQSVSRGKIECRAQLTPAAHAAPSWALQTEALERLALMQQAVRAQLPEAAPLTVAEILRWPGVLASAAIDAEALSAHCLALFEDVMADFLASRAREGARLSAELAKRLARMREILAQVEAAAPEAIADYSTRLAARLREALDSLDEERIRQEISLYAAKIDVAEELARLAAHIEEASRVLEAGGAVGKRLDFLMQELNREANTLAAKSVSLTVTQSALELRLLIEQMREQVQNLE